MDGRNLQKALEEKLLAGEIREAENQETGVTELETQRAETPEVQAENDQLNQLLSDTTNKINFTRDHLKIFELLSPGERDQLYLSIAATDSLQVKDIDWEKLFQHPDAHALLKTILAIPGRLSLQSEQDIKMILKLHDEIGPAKLKATWKKLGEPLLERSFVSQIESDRKSFDWSRFYLYLVIGSFEKSTLNQLELLSEAQLKKIELVLKVYGKAELEKQWTPENLEDFEELEQMNGNYQRDREDLLSATQFTENLSPEVIRHLPQETGGGSGTSSRKRPDHTIWHFQGIHGKYDQLIRFQRCLGVLPTERLDRILSVLKPSKYPVREPAENISLGQADNFLQFVQTARLEGRLNLEQLFDNAVSFSPEKYVPIKGFLAFLENQHLSNSITEINFPSFLKMIGESTAQEIEQIKTGTVKYCELGLAKMINWKQNWGDLLKKVSLPESETANQLLKDCVEHHEQYVGKRYSGERNFSLLNRDGSSVLGLYEAISQIEEYFRDDQELMFKIGELGEDKMEIIRLVLNGQYKKNGSKEYDLPVLEGLLVQMPGRLQYVKPILDRAKTLSSEQKRSLFFLSSYFHSFWGHLNQQNLSILETYINSGKARQMEEFLKNFPIKGFGPETIEKMADSGGPATLFAYIDPRKYKPEILTAIIDKLIAFHSAGMDKRLYENPTQNGINPENISLENLLSVDVGKFVRIANFLANYNCTDPLYYLTNLNFDESEEKLMRRIRQASATDYFWNYRETVLDEEDLLVLEKEQLKKQTEIRERISFAGKLFGAKLTGEKIKNLESLAEAVWQRLKSNQKILELFIETSGRISLREEALALSDAMLTEPLVWQYHLLEQIFDDALMESALQMILECKKQGVEDIFREENSPSRIDLRGLTEVAKVWDENREYLQEPGFLKIFEGRGGLLRDFLNIKDSSKNNYLPPALRNNDLEPDMDENQQRKILPWLQHFDVENGWDWKAFIKWIEDKNYQLPPDEILSVLHQYLGERIPYIFAKAIIERCNKGEKPEDICAGLDNGSSKNDEDGIDNYRWRDARNDNYSRQIQAILGNDAEFTSKHLTVGQCEQALKMSRQQLENLWKMGVLKSRGEFKYPQTNWDNAVYIANHPNFDLIASADNDGYLFLPLFREIPVRIHFFCDRIDWDILQKWQDVQAEMKLDLVDSVDFFNYPGHQEIIEFAGHLKEILGKQLQVSAYDLLIMDVQKDLPLLRELKTNCALGLSEDNLKALAVASSGEMQNTIKKVLSILDNTSQIDYGLAAEKIGEMSPGLRYAVLKNKGISAFGPDILRFKDQVRQLLSREEWTKFVRELFAEKHDAFNTEVDFDMASIILTDPSFVFTEENDWYLNKFLDLFRAFNGSEKEWTDLIDLAGDDRLACTFKRDWNSIASGLKKNLRYWRLLKDRNTELFFQHLKESPASLEIEQEYLEKAIGSVSVTGLHLLLEQHEKGLLGLTDVQTDRVLVRYLSIGGQIFRLMETEFNKTSLEKLWIKTVNGWPDFPSREKFLGKTVTTALSTTDFGQITLPAQAEAQMIQAFTSDKLDDPEINRSLGTRLSGFGDTEISAISRVYLKNNINKLQLDYSKSGQLGLQPDNWLAVLMAYIKIAEDLEEGGNFHPPLAETIQEIFKDDQNKDFCLKQLEGLWKEYLSGGSKESIPANLLLLANFVRRAEGAGPLSKIESMLLMVEAYLQAQRGPNTAPRTKEALFAGQKDLGRRFEKERWSEDDRADFQNIFRTITLAAPSLATDFLEMFKKMNLKDIKKFMSELFPLFNVEILMMEKGQGRPGARHDLRSLVGLRKKIREIKSRLQTGSASFDQEKLDLIKDIQQRFQARFGIIKTPQAFGAEQLKALINCSVYLSNLVNPTDQKQCILAFYLALILNGQWESFRRGESVDPGEYMSPPIAARLTEVMEGRQKMLDGLWAHSGIREEDQSKFQELLQTEEAVIEIGNVETVDVKLANLAINMKRLEDPDLYPAQLDRDRMKLLVEFGNKKVGAVVAKTYLSLTGKQVELNEDEQLLRQEIERILIANNLPLQAETVKKHFQEEMKPLALISNVLSDINNLKVEEEIESLRNLLRPGNEIISIFKRLGEDFQPASGALALSQDLDFLDNLIVKKEAVLQESEKRLLQQYISGIRGQLVKLEGIYQQLKLKFAGVKGAQHGNELLRSKLQEIDRILNTTDSGQVSVSSVMTNNLSNIIENIRECLSCVRKGINNDTNLTFGDGNKFFLYSHSELQKRGSLADQILFLEPVSYGQPTDPTEQAETSDRAGEIVPAQTELAFVLDRLYGNCTPFVLINHVKAVYKKYKVIKDNFPGAKLSIFVSESAFRSSGTDSGLLATQLSNALGKEVIITPSQAKVYVLPSAQGDHYVEFGGVARTSGERTVSGLKISL